MRIRKWSSALLAMTMMVSVSATALAETVPGAVYGGEENPVSEQEVIDQMEAYGLTTANAETVADGWAAQSFAVLAQIGITDVIVLNALGEVQLEAPLDQSTTMSVFAKVLGIASKTDSIEVAAQKATAAGLAPAPVAGREMSRMDVARMIAIALGIEPVPFTDAMLYPFNDYNEVNDADARLMVALYDAGIFKGFDDRTFQPDGILTTSQIATLIDRVLSAK